MSSGALMGSEGGAGRPRREFACLLVVLALLPAAVGAPPSGPGASAGAPGRRLGLTPALSNEEAWKRLPRAERGAGQPLPGWARVLAPSLPYTTAAMLELDHLHRASEGATLTVNVRLVLRNAELAGEIAAALAEVPR